MSPVHYSVYDTKLHFYSSVLFRFVFNYKYMHNFQKNFIEFAIHCQALRFGRFTLKSGRISPYFFNAGAFNTSGALAQLGSFYAEALQVSSQQFDGLFGPAYKGIPLATSMGVALYRDHGLDLPVTFNRKEAKAHGEGGVLVGAPLKGRILIVDDVITAGTAIRESITIIRDSGAEAAGVLVALDRKETGPDSKQRLSAIAAVTQEFGIPVTPIITLAQILDYLNEHPDLGEHRDAVAAYRANYGAA